MGLSLKRLFEEAKAQVNPFDNGRTAATVRASYNKPAPAQTVSAKNAPLKNIKPFGNPQIEQAAQNLRAGKLSAQAFGDYVNSFGPAKQWQDDKVPIVNTVNALKNATSASGDAVKAVGTPFVRTAQAANLARQGKGQEAKKALDESIIGGVGRFGQSIASTALTPVSNRVAQREASRATRLLTPAYSNLYKAYGADPRLGANQASIEASQAKYNLQTDPLNRSNIGVNDSLGTTTRKILAQAGEAGFDVLTLPAVGGATKTAIKSTGKTLRKDLLKPALIGGAGNTLFAAQQDNTSPLDYAKNFGMGAATAVAIPAVAGQANKLARGTASKLTDPVFRAKTASAIEKVKAASNPATAELQAKRTELLKQYDLATPQTRKFIEKSIQDIDNQVRSINQGGFVKVPFGKNVTTGLSKEQTTFINEYANMLESMGSGNGVNIMADGRRVSSNFRTAETKGKAMTKADWFDEARRQLESGKAGYGASDEYKTIKAIQTPLKDEPTVTIPVDGAKQVQTSATKRSKEEWQALYGSVPYGTDMKLKVQQPNNGSNIPVRKMTRAGDVVTAKNVNPNVKATEKRYSVDEKGELIEDRKGATSLFTDDEGRVKGFRIGQEYFDAKQLGDLSNINNSATALKTMRRNVERSFGKETGDKVNNFLVDHQQAQATKMITRMQELNTGLKQVADELGISFKIGRGKAKKVSADIQNFGEKKITRAELDAKYGKEYANKIVQADNWFRNKYDSLLDEMNTTLTQYGYDPVPKRANYYTHFQDENVWKKFGLKMQEIRNMANPTMQDATPNGTRGKIDNNLAGQSEFLQPNKRFNQFALQRKGDIATPDAFQAFERYMNPTLNNIYMTPSIARARVLSRAIAQDANIMGKDANTIIVQTREWANRLAGKSNRFDRPIIDTNMGNKALRAVQWTQKKAGQNSIVGNLATATMQPIVMAQTSGKFGYKNTILGLMQEISPIKGNDPIKQSSFIQRRYADLDNVTSGKLDAARNIANKPLELVEGTAARATWRAAYNDALSKDMPKAQAIKYADIESEKTLAGRSIGEKPELFESKAAGLATMYQLEVNNFWQQFSKEMTKTQAAKTLVAAYGLNLVLQQVTGRQVGFNPIDTIIESYQEIQKEDKSPVDKAKTIGKNTLGEIVDNVPFVAPVANFAVGDKNLRNLLGGDSNTGRFGVSSPVSTLVNNPEDLILPFGGSQIRKTVGGVQTLMKGGVDDKKGDRSVDVKPSIPNTIKGIIYGKNAIPEVNAYNSNIGKKKVDQIPVPNQVDSKAKNQGAGVTKDNKSSIMTAAFSTPEAKKFMALSDADKKFYQNEPEYKGLYSKWKNMKQALAPDNQDYANLDDNTQKTLNTFDRLSDAGKKNYLKNNPNMEYELERAKFEKDKAGGELTRVQEIKRQDELNKLEIGVKYEKDIREVGSLSKRKVYEIITKDPNGKKIAEQLLKYNDELLDAGLITNHPYRDKNGKPDFDSVVAKSGKKKGGKKGKYDYKMFGLDVDPVSTSKSLRDLVKKAKLKA